MRLVAVLPAYAGMIPAIDISTEDNERAPRVCGDDPVNGVTFVSGVSCSPRMRG